MGRRVITPPTAVETAEMQEFSRRQSFPYVEVRRMTGERYADIILSYCGTELGSCHIGYRYGKVFRRMHVLPKLDKGERVPPGFHLDTPITHDPAGEPHAR